MGRRGFSLVEVVVALALLATLGIPLVAQKPAQVLAYGPARSTATALLKEAAELCLALPRERLTGLLLAGTEAGNGLRALDPAALGLGAGARAAAIRGLFGRITRDVLGQAGLDRIDLVVEYREGDKARYAARSALVRNTPLLDALAQVRADGTYDGFEGEAYQAAMADAVETLRPGLAAVLPAGEKFVVPVLHPRLVALAPHPTDPEAIGERLADLQLLETSTRYVLGGSRPAGPLPRPPLEPGTGAAY